MAEKKRTRNKKVEGGGSRMDFEKRFIKERKKLLKEEQLLTYQRETINKQLRAVRRSMAGWDRVLLQREDGEEY